ANRPVALYTASPMKPSTPTPTPTRPETTVTPQEQSAFEPTPAFIRQTIVDSTFPVGAREYQDYSFTVAGNRRGHLTGSFTATGGSNDIDVWVIDENQMLNFTNGHSTYFYYHSKYVSYGEI